MLPNLPRLLHVCNRAISHQYRCIFIHIPKTAGTSIEHKLGHIGEQDHRAIRHYQKLSGKLLAQSLSKRKFNGMGYNESDFLRGASREFVLRHLRFNHCQFSDIYRLVSNTVRQRATVSRRQFTEYFKFTFVRNPWARIYSWYRGVMRDEIMRRICGVPQACSFRDFMLNYSNFGLLPQLYWMQDVDGHIPLDYIGKFENLRSDFNFVLKTLGIEDTTIPWVLSGGKSDYHDHYDAELRDLVADRYTQEIALFGYQYEDKSS
jgi:hypothetical protein